MKGSVIMKVSVIMPLYSAETFLRESLDSLLRQELHDMELICIDDASSDSTVSIVEEYQKNDKRVRLIFNQEHLGAALSRNKGILHAEGDYLTFLDGDDIFESDLLRRAYEAAVWYNADVVDFPYKVFQSDNMQQEAKIIHSDTYKEKFCRDVFSVSQIKPCEFMNCHSGPCRLFRRAFIEREKLQFQDLPSCNDVFFTNMALLLADKIHFLEEKKVLLRVRNHNTPSRISFKRDPMCAFLADKKTLEELVSRNAMKRVYKQIYYRIYCHLLITLKNIKEIDVAKEFYHFLSKEGIDLLLDIGKEFLPLLEEYILRGLKRFKEESFESEWYKEESELSSFLYENNRQIGELFSLWKKQKSKTGLWGVGQYGCTFLKFCREQQYDIDAVIDCNEGKHGNIISGFPAVCFPEEICYKLQIVILTSSNLVSEVAELIKDNNWKLQIVDINMYIGR